jgi:hypothetical protein
MKFLGDTASVSGLFALNNRSAEKLVLDLTSFYWEYILWILVQRICKLKEKMANDYPNLFGYNQRLLLICLLKILSQSPLVWG